MAKKNYNKKNIPKSQSTTTAGNNFDDNDNSMLNPIVNAADENENEFFDKTDKVMKKRKEHLNDFYHNVKRTKVVSNIEDDNEDDTLDESTENPNHELPNNGLSNSTKSREINYSCSNDSADCSSSNVSLTTSSYGPHFSSTPNNTEKRLELNKSILLHNKNQSDQSLTNKRSSEMIGENNCDRFSSSSKHMDKNTLAASDSNILSQTTSNTKVPYISQSTITLETSTTTNKHMDYNSNQCSNNFIIDRSLICSSTINSASTMNRSSTNNNFQWKPIDIKNSMEYRDLEKKNKDLLNKIDNLKEALSKERKERKKMNETHILKPRTSFWNELSIFMESHGDSYQGDSRTIHEIGRELGLTDNMIQYVQRDTDKPDKVAMNIWRKLCPTIEDKVFVRSIKRVPTSTLDNIYAFARLSHPKSSLDYKKMRNDIAANIRQGNLSHRTHGALLMNQNYNEENDADNDDNDGENNSDNDDDDEENESNSHANDFQSRIRTSEVVDDSSNDEEE
ncbi:unnamed protein product [Rotaria sp. Silwood1]|nr:unnamed protein product [Rotaria sp. Silwood1]CAF3782025.1 unnamed protein product [Rotaria sp. Silwood1]CAF3879357.1 unnamed protein product [Rotaria sp. Silwood1]CAF3881675.1 unnamed protein product [Rotaria sp. Silwood1]